MSQTAVRLRSSRSGSPDSVRVSTPAKAWPRFLLRPRSHTDSRTGLVGCSDDASFHGVQGAMLNSQELAQLLEKQITSPYSALRRGPSFPQTSRVHSLWSWNRNSSTHTSARSFCSWSCWYKAADSAHFSHGFDSPWPRIGKYLGNAFLLSAAPQTVCDRLSRVSFNFHYT